MSIKNLTTDNVKSWLDIYVNKITVEEDVILNDNSYLNVANNALNGGVISGFEPIVDNLDGTVDIAGGQVYLRVLDGPTYDIKELTVAPLTAFSMIDNQNNYVFVDYNGGSPWITSTLNPLVINNNDRILLYVILREGTELTIKKAFQYANNNTARTQQFLDERFQNTRSDGLALGDTGVQNVTVTIGTIWNKYNKLVTTNIDTFTGSTYNRYYRVGATYTRQTGVTQWNNSQWNDTTVGLSPLSLNYYTFEDFYMLTNDKLISIYGTAEFSALSQAENAPIEPVYPPLQPHSIYIGRIVCKNGIVTPEAILSPFGTDIDPVSSVGDHTHLINLTVDSHPQYVTLANRGGETLDIDNIDIQTNLNLNQSTGNALQYTDGSKDVKDASISSNLTLTAGVLDTVQDIQTISDVQFNSVETKLIDGGAFDLDLQGSLGKSIRFKDDGGAVQMSFDESSGSMSLTTGPLNVNTINDYSGGTVTLENTQFSAGGMRLNSVGATVNQTDTDLTADLDTRLVTQKGINTAINTYASSISSGVINGFAITDNLDGTVDVAGGDILIKTSDTQDEVPLKYTVTGVNGVSIAINNETYIYVDYNAGTPVILTTTTLGDTIKDNENNLFELYEIVRNSTTQLHITKHFQLTANVPGLVQMMLYDRFGALRTAGLMMSEPSALAIAITQGTIWLKVNKITWPAFDSSGADTFDVYYDNGAGGHTLIASQSTVSNTQYDGGAGSLVNLNTNRYGFHEVWVETDGDVVVLYGTVNSNAIADARNAPVITDVPERLGDHGTYVGRVIIQEGTANIVEFLNPFDIFLTYTATTDHGALGGLNDDDHPQYQLLAGRSGGQTMYGGTGASENLTIGSTSNATKGSIILDNFTLNGSNVLNTGDIYLKPVASGRVSFRDSSNTDQLYMDESSGAIQVTTKLTVSDIQSSTGTGDVTINPNATNGDGILRINRTATATDVCALYYDSAGVPKWSSEINAGDQWVLNNWTTVGTAMSFNIVSDCFIPRVYSSTANARDVYINSTGQMGYLISLQESKMNISEIQDFSYIYSLTPKKFNYRKWEYEQGTTNKNYLEEPENANKWNYFFIAEDVASVDPNLCFYDDETNKTGLAGVERNGIVAGLVGIVKEQKALIDDLTARVEALEGA